jgi:hypothetical protein
MTELKSITGTITSAEFIRKEPTTYGTLEVYNYTFKEYRGIMQSRHKHRPLQVGTKAEFEAKFVDKKAGIVKGTMVDVNKKTSFPETKMKNNDFPIANLKAQALIAAANTKEIETSDDVLITAKEYYAWLINNDPLDQ